MPNRDTRSKIHTSRSDLASSDLSMFLWRALLAGSYVELACHDLMRQVTLFEGAYFLSSDIHSGNFYVLTPKATTNTLFKKSTIRSLVVSLEKAVLYVGWTDRADECIRRCIIRHCCRAPENCRRVFISSRDIFLEKRPMYNQRGVWGSTVESEENVVLWRVEKLQVASGWNLLRFWGVPSVC